VGASAHTVGQRGFVWASASSTPDRAQETLDVMLAEFAKLSAGVTDEEFARARTGLVTATVFGMESMRGRAASLARDWLLLGRVRDADEVQARLAALSRADLDDFLRRRPFGPPAIMTLGPAALEVSRVLV
jgi:predicted Zn-dependent peptidase